MHYEPPLGNLSVSYRQAICDIVQWVASTARATGQDVSERKKPTSFLQKLKDKRAAPRSLIQMMKGRKQAPRRLATTEVFGAIEISYKTLKRFGKAIGDAEGVEVPFHVLVVLKGVIHAWKGFAT
jgi:hypothetical protein